MLYAQSKIQIAAVLNEAYLVLIEFNIPFTSINYHVESGLKLIVHGHYWFDKKKLIDRLTYMIPSVTTVIVIKPSFLGYIAYRLNQFIK